MNFSFVLMLKLPIQDNFVRILCLNYYVMPEIWFTAEHYYYLQTIEFGMLFDHMQKQKPKCIANMLV